MVDRHDAAACVPYGGFRGRIGEQRPQLGIVRGLTKDDVELAVEQHLKYLLVLRRALGGVDIFGDMRVFERDPADLVEVDAVVVGEDAPDPGAGRSRERTDADALAFEIGRPEG